MNWYPAPAITSLQRDLNEAFPHRILPDGIIGDAAHSARDSDHNPDEGGMVHAIDIRLGGSLVVKSVLNSVMICKRRSPAIRLRSAASCSVMSRSTDRRTRRPFSSNV